jgi:poly-gamma-glutamate capsule biosynthesis protein CapA/YwtB (metallophosphatase superfamily)
MALVAGTVACSGSPSAAPSTSAIRSTASRSGAAGTIATPGPTASASDTLEPPATSRWPVTLSFGGDVHFAEYVAGLLKDPRTSLADLRPYLAHADVAMVNLETAITTRGNEAPKEFHFRTTEDALEALQAAGVDVVTMANNHAVDYGSTGLKDTLAAVRRSPVPVVGIGADAAQAYAAAYLDVRGVRVAVLGATQVPDWTLATWSASGSRAGVASAATVTRLAAAVRLARARAEVVVVYLHWGTDYTTCPNALQQRTAKALAAAGADVVVGSHAHRLQGGGWLGRTYVDYGLGNFIWWRSRRPDATTGVLTLTVDRPAGAVRASVTRASFAPLTISADGVPRAGGAVTKATSAWQKLRACSGLSAAPSNG